MPDLTASSHQDDDATSLAICAAVSQQNTTPLVPDAKTSLRQLCAGVHTRLMAFLAEESKTERLRNVQEQTRVSMGVIERALKRYSIEEYALAYNGGKDCLVLLILYLGVLHTKLSSSSTEASNGTASPTPRIPSVYIQAQHPFPEVEAFVKYSISAYSLNLASYNKPMKAAFADYLADQPKVKAIFVGTRRTDPHGEHLTHFDPTDSGWPSFMRVHPVIDWHYVEIWTFIRYLNIPYCPLYDRGYTSLGGTDDTLPNPALKKGAPSARVEKTDSTEFRPAYELIEDMEERLGRDR